MNTRSKVLVAALMASAVGIAATPSFAEPGDGMRKQTQQMAHRDDDRRGGDEHRRGGPGHHGAGDRDGHGPRGPGGPGGMGDGPRGGMPEILIERFDVNEDGTITAEEIATVNAERVGEYDTDGNGALSLEEFKALWADTMNLRIVRDFQQLDPDGDASVTLEEYSVRYDTMLERLDRNDDGAIDEAELAGPRGGPGGPGKGHGGPGMGKGPGPGNGPGMGNGPGDGMGKGPGNGPGKGPGPKEPAPQNG